jgi:hypothetical protein
MIVSKPASSGHAPGGWSAFSLATRVYGCDDRGHHVGKVRCSLDAGLVARTADERFTSHTVWQKVECAAVTVCAALPFEPPTCWLSGDVTGLYKYSESRYNVDAAADVHTKSVW